MTDKPDMQITQISSKINLTLPSSQPVEQAQLQKDYDYRLAQQYLQSLLDCGLISLSEFNKIMLLNRQSFSPYLVEILPEIR